MYIKKLYKDNPAHGAVLAAWLLSWVFFRLSPETPLEIYMQYADLALLRDSPWLTIYHFHAAAPGPNLALALLLQFFEGPGLSTAILVLHQLGLLALAWMAARLTQLWGGGTLAAAGAGIVVLVWPPIAKQVHSVGYHFSSAVLVTAAVWALAEFDNAARLRWFVLFAFFAAAAAWMRAFYHPLIFTLPLAFAAAWWTRRGSMRRTRYALAFAALALAWLPSSRVYELTGVPAASSWSGMNVAGLADPVYPDQRTVLIEKKQVSPLAAMPRFPPPSKIQALIKGGGRTGIEVLDSLTKRDGSPNYNHYTYPAICAQVGDDALVLARHYPGRAALGRVNQAYLFLTYKPYIFFHSKGFKRWWHESPAWEKLLRLAALPMLMVLILAGAIRQFWKQRQLASAKAALFVVAYVGAMALAFELGEGGLHRMEIDALALSGLAAWAGGKLKSRGNSAA